ncbi:MAG: ABC transporter ATP-binding protein [Phycisphaerae bacterium]|nr:ABC transporter ATP-binding protein [Phycisphaerae bacterium]
MSEVETDRVPPLDIAVSVSDLHKSFGLVPVLRGVSLDFPRGKTTVVLGPSGCGKSVMLKHIVGLLKPDRGRVYLGQTRVDTMAEHQLAEVRRRFGFLFQLGALFDSMSVRENVRFPLAESGLPDDARSEARVRHVLRMVGLEDALPKMPAELSGGQQKRVALARAIVLEPEVILYDEPTTGLDPIRADVINELILKLARQLDVTSIVVTHDLASAFKVADRMVMLHEGQVRLEGPPDAFRHTTDPVVQRFLRGEASDDDLAPIRAVDGSGVRARR